MKTNILRPFRSWALVLCCVLLSTARAENVEPVASSRDASVQAPVGPAGAAPPAAAVPGEEPQRSAPADDAHLDDKGLDSKDTSSADDRNGEDDWATPPDNGSSPLHHHRRRHHGNDNDVVSIGRKAELSAGQKAGSVVAIFGSAISAGEVSDAVVSILGNTHVTGKVGDAAVAVMGSVYVNSEVDGDVVAVLGNVELGPEARVRGNVVVIGGVLTRDPSATIGGEVQTVFGAKWTDFDWLRPWIQRCLLYGRPLAFAHGLGWAWGMALGLLALYVFIAFLFRSEVERCVRTLEEQPGQSVLAALIAMLLTPVLFVLLCITVLGIAAIPFLVLALICAAIFGKVVVLAALGRRCTPFLAHHPRIHTVAAVLVGGVIALVLYTIPVVGFIVYKLLGILGLGVVVYTLILAIRAGGQGRAASNGGAGPGSGGPGGLGGGATAAGAGLASGPAGNQGPAGGAAAGAAADGRPAFGDFSGRTDASGGEAASAAGAAGPSAAAGGFASSGAAGPGAAGQGAALAATLPRAGFWIRMGALFLDVLIVGIVLHTVRKGVDLNLIVLATYAAVMWKLKASTIGGIICGLQVVRLDGRPIDWATAIVRALSCFLSLAVVGLGFLWIAIDSEKQSWHDKIAGTVVVRAPKGASLL